MTIPGLLRAGKKIAQRADGLRALPYYTSSERRVALWTKESDLRSLVLPVNDLQVPCSEFIEANNLVICTMSDGGDRPAKVVEYGLEPMRIIESFDLGTSMTRWGASCALTKTTKGALFANYRKDEPILDVCYRNASPIPMPGAPKWSIQTFPFTSNRQYLMSMAEGPDGLAWLFYVTDGGGYIGLARFRCTDKVYLVENTSLVLPANFGISQEMPDIVAIPAADRIVLGYQNHSSLYPPKCQLPGITIVTSSACCLTSVYPDKHTEPIAALPWENKHDSIPAALGWPRRDGVYFTAPYYDREVCSGGWKTGRAVNGQLLNVTTDGPGDVMSYSDDGWLLFREPLAPGQFQPDHNLIKFKFAPELKIKRLPAQNVQISWDEPSANDQLQVSTDLKHWMNYGASNATSPVSVPTAGDHSYFRLLQHPT